MVGGGVCPRGRESPEIRARLIEFRDGVLWRRHAYPALGTKGVSERPKRRLPDLGCQSVALSIKRPELCAAFLLPEIRSATLGGARRLLGLREVDGQRNCEWRILTRERQVKAACFQQHSGYLAGRHPYK
jgi:hypothetical protein